MAKFCVLVKDQTNAKAPGGSGCKPASKQAPKKAKVSRKNKRDASTEEEPVNESSVVGDSRGKAITIKKDSPVSRRASPVPAGVVEGGIIANPKTAKERRNNTRILKDMNVNYCDDFFSTGSLRVFRISSLFSSRSRHNRSRWIFQVEKRKDTKRVSKAADIVKDLFDSDSENNFSIHSARTPIGSYMNLASRDTTRASRSEIDVESALCNRLGV